MLSRPSVPIRKFWRGKTQTQTQRKHTNAQTHNTNTKTHKHKHTNAQTCGGVRVCWRWDWRWCCWETRDHWRFQHHLHCRHRRTELQFSNTTAQRRPNAQNGPRCRMWQATSTPRRPPLPRGHRSLCFQRLGLGEMPSAAPSTVSLPRMCLMQPTTSTHVFERARHTVRSG